MNLPEISFVPLQKNDLVTLTNYMKQHDDERVFLVYLRFRYEHETQWEYFITAGCLYEFDQIIWFDDWWEGQEHVEYLGITQIKEEE